MQRFMLQTIKINKPVNSKQQIQNPKQIVEPFTFQAVTLDDISVKLSQLIDISILNHKLLNSVLKELKDEADKGGYIRLAGTVTTNQFVIIDTFRAPNHPVKGYIVRNDGANPIFVAHNASLDSNTGIEPFEVASDTTRFETIHPNEDVRFRYNRNTIKNVYLLASGGDSTYRCWLVW